MKRFLPLVVLPLLILLFNRCEPDEPKVDDPNAPSITLISTSISTAPNTEFWIEATLSDDVELKKVNLSKEDWFLNKDIILSDSSRKEYSLLYKFLTPAEATDEKHYVIISVEDVGGNITTAEVPVLLNADVTPPEIIVTSPSEGQNVNAGELVDFVIEVTDNTGIDSFMISSPDLGIEVLYAFDPVKPQYWYRFEHAMPDPIEDGTYFVNIIATDSSSNKTVHIVSLTVGEVAVGQVYCVGGASFGGWQVDNPMPMTPDSENPGWYETTTYSWGVADYEGVKFVGQKGWNPHNWGLDPSDPTKMVNAENSEKIILGGGAAGYYKVRFNPTLLEYTQEAVEATTPEYSNMYMLGAGIAGMEMAWTDPSTSLSMIQDPDNPYIYTLEAEFSDVGPNDWGANFIFIGNKSDVSEFNLGFRNIPAESVDPAWVDYPGYVFGDIAMELDPLTEDELAAIPEPWDIVPYVAYYEQAGTYTIKLDYHIRQASITKVTE